MSDLILSGERIPCAAPVLTWEDTGLAFVAGVHRRTRVRDVRPDTIVWHWTGGEPRGPATTYKVLRQRGLGVEFAIGRDGEIWQFCDPGTTDARDCGAVWDRRSIGVEVINYGSRRPASRPWSWHVPRRGRDREVIETRLRGRRAFVAAFHAAQLAAADALADSLRLVYHIPHSMPRDEDGRILDRPMSRQQRDEWDGGEVGHLQITTRAKSDPGVPFLEHRARALGLSV